MLCRISVLTCCALHQLQSRHVPCAAPCSCLGPHPTHSSPPHSCTHAPLLSLFPCSASLGNVTCRQTSRRPPSWVGPAILVLYCAVLRCVSAWASMLPSGLALVGGRLCHPASAVASRRSSAIAAHPASRRTLPWPLLLLQGLRMSWWRAAATTGACSSSTPTQGSASGAGSSGRAGLQGGVGSGVKAWVGGGKGSGGKAGGAGVRKLG